MDDSDWWILTTNLPPTSVTNLFDDALPDTEGFYRIRVVR
jgi:hypothetical protein